MVYDFMNLARYNNTRLYGGRTFSLEDSQVLKLMNASLINCLDDEIYLQE